MRIPLSIALACSVVVVIGCAEEQVDSADATTADEPTVAPTGSPIEPFKCEITLLAGEESFQVSTYFRDQYAIEFDHEDESKIAAVYDLDNLWWQDFESTRKVTMEDCENWARASVELSRTSLSKSTDPEVKRFVERLLDPEFVATRIDDEITFSNDVFTYRVSNPMPLDNQQRQRFFAYDRLNAFRKAMMDRKLPPFPQLAVDDELENRQFVPGQIELTIVTPNGDVHLKVSLRVADMTEVEAERVAHAIRRAGGT